MEDLVMTSDKTKKKDEKSAERRKLDLVLSDHQVNLSKFTPAELQGFLQEWLYKLDPRELRGFTELKQTLHQRGEPPFSVSSSVADDAEIVLCPGFDGSFDLKTHTMWAFRGAVSGVSTYRRHETNEETTDRQVVSSWGKQGYLHHGEMTTLLLRRQPNHSYGDKNLILVTCHFEKVPHEDRYLVHRIVAVQISPDSFSERFGDKAPEIAVTLIWALRDIFARTHSALVSTASAMERHVGEWEKIASAITWSR